ncbi:hypothetical protein CgunFtcFv8_009438 [Champsocephalus gunnari]|uniref:Uncharacterized protein n=1 Tax=Champsocephalus gunnari TaxID=52237 RepID=A0AAN8C2T4_CHAGU|nr:hypothetical protein CgunFtcFv8_009438 [Champsocephalus gunnari]
MQNRLIFAKRIFIDWGGTGPCHWCHLLQAQPNPQPAARTLDAPSVSAVICFVTGYERRLMKVYQAVTPLIAWPQCHRRPSDVRWTSVKMDRWRQMMDADTFTSGSPLNSEIVNTDL